MACSKYEYVKKFEQTRTSLPQTYIMVRIDGRGFTKFCTMHNFQKPNDLRAINLMNQSARYVCQSFTEIFLAYGQSDQYSFVFNKNTTLFSRRIDKILSCVVSAFSSAYVFNWKKYFQIQLKQIPTFDSRIVTYPNDQCIKDYFRWRQVDCHINNLYNTTFWCMAKTGIHNNQQVQQILKDTNSAKKNQILFTQFGINYNNIDEIYRRGTFLLYVTEKIVAQEKQQSVVQELAKMELQQKEQKAHQSKKQQTKKHKQCDKIRRKLIYSHQDCIKQQFWNNLLK